MPPGIGVGRRDQQVAALRTSDGSGIIHVNSGDDQSVFTLGQFFDAWQVARVTGPPHQEITVTTRPGSRTAIPAGYAFPPGT